MSTANTFDTAMSGDNTTNNNSKQPADVEMEFVDDKKFNVESLLKENSALKDQKEEQQKEIDALKEQVTAQQQTIVSQAKLLSTMYDIAKDKTMECRFFHGKYLAQHYANMWGNPNLEAQFEEYFGVLEDGIQDQLQVEEGNAEALAAVMHRFANCAGNINGSQDTGRPTHGNGDNGNGGNCP